MSRVCFWTILIGTEATSFRAVDKETLVPTLRQLQRRHPEAVIMWFERGQIYESPAAAAEARILLERERRPKTWRPGGQHEDPRARFDRTRDEKRRLFAKRQRFKAGDPPAGGRTDRARGPDETPRRRPVSAASETRPWRSPKPPADRKPRTAFTRPPGRPSSSARKKAPEK